MFRWSLTFAVGGTEASEERCIGLGVFVEHAGVDRGGKEVVRGDDRVDVAREVQVHLLHRDDLGVPAPGRPALDPEGGTL